jgi:hypothetical protein
MEKFDKRRTRREDIMLPYWGERLSDLHLGTPPAAVLDPFSKLGVFGATLATQSWLC